MLVCTLAPRAARSRSADGVMKQGCRKDGGGGLRGEGERGGQVGEETSSEVAEPSGCLSASEWPNSRDRAADMSSVLRIPCAGVPCTPPIQ